MDIVIHLLFALVGIVVAAEIFTNALEHFGERLKISEGVTGSLFAAVATAMPESIVPLLALLAGTENADVNYDIGVGAILGAPLMLSTIALSLMALFAWKKRGFKGKLHPEPSGLTRDLNFFLIVFGIAGIALFIPRQYILIDIALVVALASIYFFYIVLTVNASAKLVENGHATKSEHALFLTKLGLPDNNTVMVIQLIVGFSLLVAGAKLFVNGIAEASHFLGVSVLVLSLLIIPIATELPEKVNSILWIRRRKDTLAFGNITGAMVFQGSMLPMIGILMTPWEPKPTAVVAVAITYAAALWLWLLNRTDSLKVSNVAFFCIFYFLYLGFVLYIH